MKPEAELGLQEGARPQAEPGEGYVAGRAVI